mmetsp:Transcript_1986/g.5776  ORF Transcript_1986/g.5776 Transcript_1986/m.5776 type:complete len:460 (-) Transcript_1986:223-1602(-)
MGAWTKWRSCDAQTHSMDIQINNLQPDAIASALLLLFSGCAAAATIQRLMLRVRVGHFAHIGLRDDGVVDDRLRVILADYHASGLLHRWRRLPRLVDVLVRQPCELRQIFAYIGATGVLLFLKGHRRVAAEVLVEEARAAQPEPVEAVERVVRVEQLRLEVCRASLPVLPQITASQKARHGVPAQVMDPPLGAQLRHAGIYPRVARAPLCPRCQRCFVLPPRHLAAKAIALHLPPAAGHGVVGRARHQVVEVAPHELAVQGDRRLRAGRRLRCSGRRRVNGVPHIPRRHAAKAQVRAQCRGRRCQRRRRRLWLVVRRHPRLAPGRLYLGLQPLQRRALAAPQSRHNPARQCRHLGGPPHRLHLRARRLAGPRQRQRRRWHQHLRCAHELALHARRRVVRRHWRVHRREHLAHASKQRLIRRHGARRVAHPAALSLIRLERPQRLSRVRLGAHARLPRRR